MVSVCLPSDALLQHLPSYLGFSYLGHGESLHNCSSKAQLLLLTLDEGHLLTATLPDLQRGIAPLGSPVPAQPPLLGRGVAPLGRLPGVGLLLSAAAPGLEHRMAPLGRPPKPRMQGSSSQPFLHRRSLALSAAAPVFRRGVTPLGSCPSDMGSSQLLPLPLTWSSSSPPRFSAPVGGSRLRLVHQSVCWVQELSP